MIQFNLSHAKIVDGDYQKSNTFEDSIFDGEGYSSYRNEFIILECDGFEIAIYYNLDLIGNIIHTRGDYWTPSYTEVEIDTIDVTIDTVTVDEYEVELTSELIEAFEKIVKKLI